MYWLSLCLSRSLILALAFSPLRSGRDIEARMRDAKPDVVATTAFTAEIVDALKVLKLAKDINPEVVTVVGNVHPTSLVVKPKMVGSMSC